LVVFQDLSEDEDVQVDYHNSISYKILKNVIYHSLECSRTVSYVEKHHQRFKETIVSAKCSLPLILWLDVDIIEFPAYGKIPGILEFGD